MRPRSILAIFDAPERPAPAGLRVRAISGAGQGIDLDPILGIDVFEMPGPAFPPHPHAGFSALTYVLPDSPTGFWNRDSLGHELPIRPGALHWTTAGRGVMHEEFPLEPGREAHGLQIFVNLRTADKKMAPAILHLEPQEVPVLELDGASVRVVLGTFGALSSPLAPPTPVRLLDVILAPGAGLTVPARPGEGLALFVRTGSLASDRPGRSEAVAAGQVAVSDPDGDALLLRAGPEGTRLFAFGGPPLREPVVAHGPFIAESRDALQAVMRAWAEGRMGHLAPIDHANWRPPHGVAA